MQKISEEAVCALASEIRVFRDSLNANENWVELFHRGLLDYYLYQAQKDIKNKDYQIDAIQSGSLSSLHLEDEIPGIMLIISNQQQLIVAMAKKIERMSSDLEDLETKISQMNSD